MDKKFSIEKLENLLNRDDEIMLEILPNGEIRQSSEMKNVDKPLTLKENLGGEYALSPSR